MFRLYAASEGVTGHIKTSFQKNQRLEYYPFRVEIFFRTEPELGMWHGTFTFAV